MKMILCRTQKLLYLISIELRIKKRNLEVDRESVYYPSDFRYATLTERYRHPACAAYTCCASGFKYFLSCPIFPTFPVYLGNVFIRFCFEDFRYLIRSKPELAYDSAFIKNISMGCAYLGIFTTKPPQSL